MAGVSLPNHTSSLAGQGSLVTDPEDPRRQLVQRILASPVLKRSTLLANFLLFVCERHLAGRSAEITEKQIGFHVFGRTERYNASDDNIVRSYARTLRKRLEEYFATVGAAEDLILSIPRGGYVPVFTNREPRWSSSAHHQEAKLPDDSRSEILSTENVFGFPAPSGEPGLSDTDPSLPLHGEEMGAQGSAAPTNSSTAQKTRAATASRPLWWRRYGLLLGCILTGALAGSILARGSPALWLKQQLPAARINRAFWDTVFQDSRDTFVVPADGGLVMLQSFIRQHVSLEDYANGNYRKESRIADGIVGLTKDSSPQDAARMLAKVETVGNRRYTSIADLELTAHLTLLPEVVPGRLMIRYARDLRVDDLRNSNAILIGSIEANPWVELFQQPLNFQFHHGADFGGSGIIANRHPLSGERATYASEPNDPLLRTYGLIAYLPNLSGRGHVILIEGVNMAGTQAAGEFLLDEDAMRPVLEKAKEASGEIRPFEVLVETDNIAANASRPHVLSERIGQ